MNLKVISATAILLLPLLAQAAPDWRAYPLGDRLKLSVGVYVPELDTVAAVSEVGGIPGTRIDFESDLGLDEDESTFFSSLEWRFLKRNKLTFNYYSVDRDASTRLRRPISFDGTVFPPGIGVNSFIDVDVYELAYSFSFIFTERVNLAAGVGVSAQDYNIGIASRLFPNLREEEDFVAPLPTLNVEFQYAFSDNWSFSLKGGWLDTDIEIDNNELDGRIVTGTAGIRWKTFKNLGITAGYTYFNIDGELSDEDTAADAEIEYSGPQVTVDLFF